MTIVLATAKIHILKQFTTEASWIDRLNYCACHCKDTHFEAIHNGSLNSSTIDFIVLATAKIHILKQFTTTKTQHPYKHTLCLPLQRYTFWSNSQQILDKMLDGSDCACHCKDTHFEAIHNAVAGSQFLGVIVLATAKIHILKQFTTLFLMFRLVFYCACHCKDTHFEAIHNPILMKRTQPSIVLATAKIHILKQFTTHYPFDSRHVGLCLPLQRYTFWSNSQP